MKLFLTALTICLFLSFNASAEVTVKTEVLDIPEEYRPLFKRCVNKHQLAEQLVATRDSTTVENELVKLERDWYRVPEDKRADWFINVEFQRIIRDAFRTTSTPEEFAQWEFQQCLAQGF